MIIKVLVLLCFIAVLLRSETIESNNRSTTEDNSCRYFEMHTSGEAEKFSWERCSIEINVSDTVHSSTLYDSASEFKLSLYVFLFLLRRSSFLPDKC